MTVRRADEDCILLGDGYVTAAVTPGALIIYDGADADAYDDVKNRYSQVNTNAEVDSVVGMAAYLEMAWDTDDPTSFVSGTRILRAVQGMFWTDQYVSGSSINVGTQLYSNGSGKLTPTKGSATRIVGVCRGNVKNSELLVDLKGL